MSAEAVKVAVRVRPFNGREKEQNSKCIIKMKGPITTIVNPEDQQEKEFAVDFSYWSHDGFETDDTGYNESLPGSSAFGATYASQKTVYDNLGVSMLNNAWDGYNCTMFAYGQTGAGKSYSFVGYGVNKGIMPLACTEIFGRIRDGQSDDHVFQARGAVKTPLLAAARWATVAIGAACARPSSFPATTESLGRLEAKARVRKAALKPLIAPRLRRAGVVCDDGDLRARAA